MRSVRRRALVPILAVLATVAALLTAVGTAAPAEAATAPAAVLRAPGVLTGGHELASPNGNFRLLMGRDGDVLLLDRWQRTLWSTRTAGHSGARLVLDSTGNLAVRATSGKALWASRTHGRYAVLQLHDSGNLVLTARGHLLWYTHTAIAYGAHDNPYPAASLWPGRSLTAGHQLTSARGGYRAVMGTDGGLVVSGPTGTLWTTNTNGWTGARLTFAGNGNLVLYAADGSALWQSRTRASGGLVTLGDNGNLIIYDSRGRIDWQSFRAPQPRLAPTASTSHYIRSTDDLTATGCADAKANGARSSLVVLDIGAQENDLPGGAWGVKLSTTPTKVPDTQLVTLLQSYLAGYGGCMSATGKLLLAVATNNDSRQYYTSGTVCPLPPTGSPDPLGTEGGAEWASVISQLATSAAGYPGITVAGSNDIEPDFAGCVSQASAWITALLANTSGPYVFIGSADGCPSALGSTSACAAGWTQQQIYSLAYGLDTTRSIPLPQIYTPGMAVQWANISRNGASAISFGGALSEVAACGAGGGCASLSSSSAWNYLSNQLSVSAGRRTYAGAYTTDLRVN